MKILMRFAENKNLPGDYNIYTNQHAEDSCLLYISKENTYSYIRDLEDFVTIETDINNNIRKVIKAYVALDKLKFSFDIL